MSLINKLIFFDTKKELLIDQNRFIVYNISKRGATLRSSLRLSHNFFNNNLTISSIQIISILQSFIKNDLKMKTNSICFLKRKEDKIMWPILLEFAAPLAVHTFFKVMEDDSEELDLDALTEYLGELENRTEILEAKVKSLQIAFLTSAILITGFITFGAFYFF